MKQERPVSLDLFKFKFPRMAIVSILHRVTGVIIFFAIPVFLYLLHQTLKGSDAFNNTVHLLQMPLIKLGMWIILSALAFHIIAGIRHLVMDCGYFESLNAGRMTATIILVLGLVFFILLGVWLWPVR